jgi:hypothetical protein
MAAHPIALWEFLRYHHKAGSPDAPQAARHGARPFATLCATSESLTSLND